MSDDSPTKPGLTYRDAGVDIEAADHFVSRIGWLAKSTHTASVVPHTASFAGLFRPELSGLVAPLLSATCDGVGTKLLVARDMGRFEGLGQDLVGMNVNDLLPSGSRPLFFLDYIACGKLEPAELEDVVRGIARACAEVGCVLLGGETAEMPGLYRPGEFDLAGFAVGLCDAGRLPDMASVAPGDVVLALPSSGLHSNGFSLARKALFEHGGMKVTDRVDVLGCTVGEALLEPTRLYVHPVLELMQTVTAKSGAHITGGGLLNRAGRMVKGELRVVLDPTRYEQQPIYRLIARAGGVAPHEMATTFNMGLGYLVIVSRADADRVLADLKGWLEVGRIERGAHGVDLGYAHS